MGIFVNRILNLKHIKVIGFDMDHTLVRYKSEAFEELAFYETLKKLVSLKNYPIEILEFQFDYPKVIRGLVFDIARGNILKLSRYGEVKMGLHGLNPLSFDLMRKTYKGLHIDVSQPQYYSLDTTFSISKGLLFSKLVDFKDRDTKNLLPEALTYEDIFSDIDDLLNQSHSDESLKGEVRKNIEKYVLQDQDIYDMLKNFQNQQKTLAIITNSDYEYTKLLLDYTINPFMPSGKHWSDLFDYVITLSEKPGFFTHGSRFLKVDRDSGLMSNWNTPLEKGIYQGGCARDFQKQLNLKGDQILYLGDHIYGDIVTLKKSCDWKTGLVVDELAHEIDSLRNAEEIQQNLDRLMDEKETLEKQMAMANEEDAKQIYISIRHLDEAISSQLLKYQEFFNRIWGPMMRAGQEESRLAHQIERYACIYMSKITDLKEYSPRHYFRPRRRPLPHELYAIKTKPHKKGGLGKSIS
jgi:HAD superfamily 5'-nucleotidase-like hydrolase